MPRNTWLLRLEDILEAIDKIERYIRDLDAEAFADDPRTRDAVVWNFAVIGEAARAIPIDVTQRYPDIPWDRMRGMRNIVVHEHFGIDEAIVWETATGNLPPLASRLRGIIDDERRP